MILYALVISSLPCFGVAFDCHDATHVLGIYNNADECWDRVFDSTGEVDPKYHGWLPKCLPIGGPIEGQRG
jgi:hypothetical protein